MILDVWGLIYHDELWVSAVNSALGLLVRRVAPNVRIIIIIYIPAICKALRITK